MAVLRRVANLFRRSRVDREIDAELQAHIALRIEDNMAQGMSPEEARRDALLRFGNPTATRERVAAADTTLSLAGFARDLRYALRQLRRSPGFAMTAILTLAFAIGANIVVFSLLNSLVLRPVQVPQAHNVYMIERGADRAPSHSYPDYLDLRDRNRSFEGLAVYSMTPAGLDVSGTPASIWMYEASGNYFDVLGIRPLLGRFFHNVDEHGPNSAPYIVLSYGYWKSHFQGDPSVVGRNVRLNQYAYTILGVAPEEFRGTERFFTPDLWAPIVNQQQIGGWSNLDSRAAHSIWMVGRLRPGVTPAQATADLNRIGAVLAKEYPKDDDGLTFALARPGLIGDMLRGPVRGFMSGLTLLAALILLAACANLGSLFAARATDRSREIALRMALGSTRARVLRQLLTEALLVSLGGAAVGLAGGVALLRAIRAWQPAPDMPIGLPVSADFRTYLVALLLALSSALLFGMVPVRQVMKANPYRSIKTGTAGGTATRRITLRDLLLALQIAVCAVLVTSSLVAVRGMVRSLHSNFGFDPRNALQLNTDLDMGGYRGDQIPVMQRRILDAVEAVPGVSAAAYANRVPLNLGWSDSTVFRDSATDFRPSNSVMDAVEYGVSPGYFQAAASTILQGRAFTWNDDKNAPRVAVVNQEFARKLFGSEEKAVGGHFRTWGGNRVQIIGLVEDGKYRTLSEEPQPAMFFPVQQSPSSWTWLIVRSARDPGELAPALQQTLRNLNTGLPFTINTWEKQLGTALFAARAASIALGVLGGLGGMLAVTGIFGMAAYTVSKRLRELGIRIALGAQRKQILRAVLGRVLRLLALGSAVGLLLGVAATKLLSYIVYQATPRDPLVLLGAVAAMSLVGVLATWIPARRALDVDPAQLLREE